MGDIGVVADRLKWRLGTKSRPWTGSAYDVVQSL